MDKLSSDTGFRAHLEVLKHQWEPACAWDETVLGVARAAPVLHREIVVSLEGTSCWYARTTLPKTTYDAADPLFERLQHEPLGHLIYNNPTITLASRIIVPYTKQSIEYSWLTTNLHQNHSPLWGRITCYALLKPLQPGFFLQEIFLPGLESIVNADTVTTTIYQEPV